MSDKFQVIERSFTAAFPPLLPFLDKGRADGRTERREEAWEWRKGEDCCRHHWLMCSHYRVCKHAGREARASSRRRLPSRQEHRVEEGSGDWTDCLSLGIHCLSLTQGTAFHSQSVLLYMNIVWPCPSAGKHHCLSHLPFAAFA